LVYTPMFEILKNSLIGALTVSAAKCLHYLALHHGGQNIDRNEEIKSLSPYTCVQNVISFARPLHMMHTAGKTNSLLICKSDPG